MATFRITAPDGTRYRVTGDNEQGAYDALQTMLNGGQQAAPAAPAAPVPEAPAPAQPAARMSDAMSGLDAGAPPQAMREQAAADAPGVAGALIRGAAQGITFGFADEGKARLQSIINGTDYGQNLDRVRADDAASREAHPYAYGGGQIAGGVATAVALPGAAVSSLPRAVATSGAMGAAEGYGSGEGANDRIGRALMGGAVGLAIPAAMSGLGAVGRRLVRGKAVPDAPTSAELEAARDAAYDAVDKSGARLSPQATMDMQDRVLNRLSQEQLSERRNPLAHSMAEDVLSLDMPMVSEVERLRQIIGSDVAGAADAGERRLGVSMKREISDFLDNVQPSDFVGGDGTAAAQGLRAGRSAVQRLAKEDAITQALAKGERNAAASGTGGNEVNAMRQQIKAILNNPKARRGYSPSEIQSMEAIARGTLPLNAMRMIARLDPTSGGLTNMLSLGAAGASGGASIPLNVGGYLAARGVERGTKQQIERLLMDIRRGSPSTRAVDDRILRALVAASVTANPANKEGQ